MRVITVLSQKGGSGKTTTVINLAVALALLPRHKVMICDIDPQATAYWFCGYLEQKGIEPPFDVVAETDPAVLAHLRRVDDAHTVIVDTPGSQQKGVEDILKAVIANSDYLIVPTPAAAFDVVAAFTTINKLVKPAGVPYRVLLTRVDPRTKDFDVASATQEFEAQGVPVFTSVIRSLKGHPNSQTGGWLLRPPFPDRTSANAWSDYSEFTKELQQELLAEFARP